MVASATHMCNFACKYLLTGSSNNKQILGFNSITASIGLAITNKTCIDSIEFGSTTSIIVVNSVSYYYGPSKPLNGLPQTLLLIPTTQ
jgi:hypothetical protein